RLN
ncbi:hypothetical protein S7711_11632, partial [Stachybotrys chartarum IBT 7711]